MKKVSFYFDPISPYAWLASTQMPALASKHHLSFQYIPVLLAGFLNELGQKGPAEIPSKRIYTIKDTARSAIRLGLRFEGPPAHPFNPLKALRLCAAAPEGHREKLANALMNACWGQGQDITTDSVLLEVLNKTELNPDWLSEISTPAIKEQVKQNTQNAVQKGLFGVPTFEIDGEVFWGHDRLSHVVEYAEGKLSLDQEKIQRALKRPQAAQRRP